MHRLPFRLRLGILVWLVGVAAMLGWGRAERARAALAQTRPPVGQALPTASEGRARVVPITDRSGSKLRVQVESGDTLFAIARRYGVALADLLGANRNVEPDSLFPGQELALPASTIGSAEMVAELKPYQGLFRWPLDAPLTSPFGPRWGRMHTGIDFAADEGALIHAARSGRVTTAGSLNDYGLAVVLTHPDGSRTLYGHCSMLKVKEGQEVSAGDVIAEVGSTGFSTGPHLHFEIHVADQPRNPLLFLLRND